MKQLDDWKNNIKKYRKHVRELLKKNAPENVQKLAEKYPPGKYIVKAGAPYGVSSSGTTVYVYSYTPDEKVEIVIYAENKSPSAIEHEDMLAAKYKKKPFHHKDVLTSIDPKWLEPMD